ncbi:MAG: hypothetical protein ACRCVT_06810, partial [Leadbetterella sp.]
LISAGNSFVRTILNDPQEARDIHSPDRAKRIEVYEKTWGTSSLGTIVLEPGLQTITITSPKISNGEVAELKCLELIPLK